MFDSYPFQLSIICTYRLSVPPLLYVLLHYMWLVVFMWMLMEGVVLHVKLVKVFVTYTKYYIVAFTLASYGKPR